MNTATERHREWAAANKDHLHEYRRMRRIANGEKIRAVAKAWFAANPDKTKEYSKRAYLKNRNKPWYKAAAARYREKHREQAREYQRAYFQRHKERVQERRIKYETNLKMELIAAYGGKCACPGCNESRWEFMTLDHIYGDGAEHKRRLKTSRMVYREVRKLGYPKDRYRLLCFNCNCCRGSMGYCPHEREVQHAHNP